MVMTIILCYLCCQVTEVILVIQAEGVLASVFRLALKFLVVKRVADQKFHRLR